MPLSRERRMAVGMLAGSVALVPMRGAFGSTRLFGAMAPRTVGLAGTLAAVSFGACVISRRYSARNAVAGSTSAALSAGTTDARHAIEPSASVVTVNVAVSCGCTP